MISMGFLQLNYYWYYKLFLNKRTYIEMIPKMNSLIYPHDCPSFNAILYFDLPKSNV